MTLDRNDEMAWIQLRIKMLRAQKSKSKNLVYRHSNSIDTFFILFNLSGYKMTLSKDVFALFCLVAPVAILS